MARLVLVGLPGSGKSTVAASIGRALGLDVCDTDDVLAHGVGVATAEYFRTVGEESFRAAELAALRGCLTRDAVVATGGGVVESEPARRLLVEQRTVWLDAPDEVLVSRVVGGDRPLLGDDPSAAIGALRSRRTAWYQAVAVIRIDTAGPLGEVVDEVHRAMMAP